MPTSTTRRDPVWAREVRSQRSADLAIHDPVKLARAARIVRTAIARHRLTLADVDPERDDGPTAA